MNNEEWWKTRFKDLTLNELQQKQEQQQQEQSGQNDEDEDSTREAAKREHVNVSRVDENETSSRRKRRRRRRRRREVDTRRSPRPLPLRSSSLTDQDDDDEDHDATDSSYADVTAFLDQLVSSDDTGRRSHFICLCCRCKFELGTDFLSHLDSTHHSFVIDGHRDRFVALFFANF